MERDKDGIYLLAKNGKIKNIPGMDLEFENIKGFDLILNGEEDIYVNIDILIEKIKALL